MSTANGKMVTTDGLGEFLRRERELRHISLDEVAERTKISRRYLEAIEDGEYERLPGETFIRGFIRSYAQSVGLDPQDTLLMYNQSRLVHEVPSPRTERSPTARPAWNIRPWLWLLALGAVCVGALLVGVVALREEPSRLPPTLSPGPEVKNTPTASTDLILTAMADSDTWLQVTIDGRKSQDMLLRAGQSAKWAGAERFVLSIGNARATHLKLNGHDLPMPQPTPSILRHHIITRDMLP